MRRLLLIALAAAAAASAQFVEIQVDAGAGAGEITPIFGIDVPTDEREAKLLAERAEGQGKKAAAPGGDAAHVWSLEGRADPLTEAARMIAELAGLEESPAYYRRSKWFDAGGEPQPPLIALELGARLLETPRRVRLRFEAPDFAGIAGSDGETVQVLLARRAPVENEEPPPAYALFVRNLPWGSEAFRIERYRLDGNAAGGLAAEGEGRGGLARVTARLEGPAVELVVLRKTDGSPAPGVIRMRRPTP